MSKPINPIAGLRRFDVTRRGYQPQQVDALLDLVERRFAELHASNAELAQRILELEAANPVGTDLARSLLARAQQAERRQVEAERELAELRDAMVVEQIIDENVRAWTSTG